MVIQDISELTARDLIAGEPSPSVTADLPVEALARKLLDEGLDGICVVENGVLKGVVTRLDLIYQERPPAEPSFLVFLDAMLPLKSSKKVEAEYRKRVGTTVADIMTRAIVTVTPQTPAPVAAQLMFDRKLSVLPVISGADTSTQLVGVLDRGVMLRAAFIPKD